MVVLVLACGSAGTAAANCGGGSLKFRTMADVRRSLPVAVIGVLSTLDPAISACGRHIATRIVFWTTRASEVALAVWLVASIAALTG
jgi:hypothetical protein